MNNIPKAAEPLIRKFADAFTRPTYRRFVVLRLAAIRTTGRRTVTNRLRTVLVMAPGTPVELSPRLVPTTLVELETRPGAGGVRPGSLGPRRPRVRVGGRHRRRTLREVRSTAKPATATAPTRHKRGLGGDTDRSSCRYVRRCSLTGRSRWKRVSRAKAMRSSLHT